MVKALVAIGAVAAVAIGAASAQRPAREVRREVTGTGSISGRVMTADSSHRALGWAAVTLTSDSLIVPRVVVTGDDGRFLVDRLAAGQYTLSVAKPAYVTMNYGAPRPERQGTPIALADGQSVTGADVQLTKGAALAGTIFDARGEPCSAFVTVLRWQFYDGERKYLAVKSAQSDARGQYRVFGLVPGDYSVAVSATDGEVVDATYEFTSPTDAEVDRVLQRARQPSGLDAAGAPAGPRTFGFASVFFPGTSEIAHATRVTLAPGEERTGMDVRLDLAPLSRLDGTVTSTDGTPLAGLRVTLTPQGPPVVNYRFAAFGGLSPKTVGANGTFAFTGVPPGEYNITVASPPPGRGSAPPTPATVKFAYATVTFTGIDQRVDLTLQPGMTVSGRFVREGAAAGEDNFKGASVNLKDLHIEQTGNQRSLRGDVAGDGTFGIFGVWPGRFLFTMSAPSGEPPDRWVLKSAVANGRDWLDAPFDLKPGDRLMDLVVTLTDHPSELTGHLQTPANAPATDYFIIVFSADRAHWFPNSRRIVSIRANSKGDYRIANLPAGDYLVAAVTDVENGAWFEAPFLESLAGSAHRLTIADGERKVQDLTIGK